MDIADRAQVREMEIIDDALTLHWSDPDSEPPLYLDGVRCCLDCEDPIPDGRLEKIPDAVRCVPCQELIERRRELS